MDRFVTEAEHHPVFELTPIGADSPPSSGERLGGR